MTDAHRSTAWIGVLFLFAFAIRFAFGFAHHNPFSGGGDTTAYLAAARQIVRSGGHISFDRPPLFPIFLALTYVLPGERLVVFCFAHALVSALVVLLAGRMVLRWRNPKAAVIAATIVAVDPFLIHFSAQFLTETLAVTLVFGGFYGLLTAERDDYGRSAVAGFLFALAPLCRNIFLPFLPFAMTAFCAISFQHRLTNKCLLAFVVALTFPLAVWVGYVYQTTGQVAIAPPQRGWTMYEGLNPDFDHADGIERWQDAMKAEAKARGLESDPARKERYFWEKSKSWALAHPKEFGKLMLKKFAKFWRLVPYGDYYSGKQRLVSAGYFIPLLLFAVIGAWRVLRERSAWRDAYWTLIGFIFLYTAANTIPWTQIRYRMPLHPILAVFAASGVLACLPRFRVTDE